MNDQAKRVSRPWRGYLRFSVRGLIVVVLVIGVWLGCVVRPARIQREAVAALVQEGNRVEYNRQRNKNSLVLARPRVLSPYWLVGLMGLDYFPHVTSVTLVTPSAKTMAHVRVLSQLDGLQILGYPPPERAPLAHLSGLTKITELARWTQ